MKTQIKQIKEEVTFHLMNLSELRGIILGTTMSIMGFSLFLFIANRISINGAFIAFILCIMLTVLGFFVEQVTKKKIKEFDCLLESLK